MKVITAKVDSASQHTNYILSGSMAQLPIKCSQSKQASDRKYHTEIQ